MICRHIAWQRQFPETIKFNRTKQATAVIILRTIVFQLCSISSFLGSSVVAERDSKSIFERSGGRRKLSLNMQKSSVQKYCSLLSPGQTIATCQLYCEVLRHVVSCWLKFENGQIWANNTQHVATRRIGWPNARNMLLPTMLRYVALTCCDRLAGALKHKIPKAGHQMKEIRKEVQ